MYSPTHYYVRVSRVAVFTGTRPSSQALGLSSKAPGLASLALGLASQPLGLASCVEHPEVLDVPGVLDGDPVLYL